MKILTKKIALGALIVALSSSYAHAWYLKGHVSFESNPDMPSAALTITNQNTKPLKIYLTDSFGLALLNKAEDDTRRIFGSEEDKAMPDSTVATIPAGETKTLYIESSVLKNGDSTKLEVIGSTGILAKSGRCTILAVDRTDKGNPTVFEKQSLVFENKPWGTACKNVTN